LEDWLKGGFGKLAKMEKIITLHICPNGCKNATFSTTAHVMQNWDVDALGNFIACTNDCDQVDKGPDNDNVWFCNACGAEAEMVACYHTEIELPVFRSSSGSEVTMPVDLYVEAHTALGKSPRAFIRKPGVSWINESKTEQAPDGTYFTMVEGIQVNLN